MAINLLEHKYTETVKYLGNLPIHYNCSRIQNTTFPPNVSGQTSSLKPSSFN